MSAQYVHVFHLMQYIAIMSVQTTLHCLTQYSVYFLFGKLNQSTFRDLTLSTFQQSVLPPAYLCQKEERALHGNLLSRIVFPFCSNKGSASYFIPYFIIIIILLYLILFYPVLFLCFLAEFFAKGDLNCDATWQLYKDPNSKFNVNPCFDLGVETLWQTQSQNPHGPITASECVDKL